MEPSRPDLRDRRAPSSSSRLAATGTALAGSGARMLHSGTADELVQPPARKPAPHSPLRPEMPRASRPPCEPLFHHTGPPLPPRVGRPERGQHGDRSGRRRGHRQPHRDRRLRDRLDARPRPASSRPPTLRHRHRDHDGRSRRRQKQPRNERRRDRVADGSVVLAARREERAQYHRARYGGGDQADARVAGQGVAQVPDRRPGSLARHLRRKLGDDALVVDEHPGPDRDGRRTGPGHRGHPADAGPAGGGHLGLVFHEIVQSINRRNRTMARTKRSQIPRHGKNGRSCSPG